MKKKLTKLQREALAQAGRIGGYTVYKKIGKKGMSAMGKKGGRPKKLSTEQAE